MKKSIKNFAIALVLIFALVPVARAASGHQVTITITNNGATTVSLGVSSGFNNLFPQTIVNFPYVYTFTTSLDKQLVQFTATDTTFLTDNGGSVTGTLTVDGNVVYSQTGTIVGTTFLVQ